MYTNQLLNTISNTGGWSSALEENISEDKVFSAIYDQDKLLVIDGSTNNLSTQINVGNKPMDIV